MLDPLNSLLDYWGDRAMIFDGVTIGEGGIIINPVISSGTSFPANTDLGELFYLTTGTVGLYIYAETGWRLIDNQYILEQVQLLEQQAEDHKNAAALSETNAENSADDAEQSAISAEASNQSAIAARDLSLQYSDDSQTYSQNSLTYSQQAEQSADDAEQSKVNAAAIEQNVIDLKAAIDLAVTSNNVDDLLAISDEIVAVSQDLTNIDTVASNISSVNIVASGIIPLRIQTIENTATIIPNIAIADVVIFTSNLASGILDISAPVGTPVNMNRLILQLQTVNIQTINWDAIYTASNDLPLPTSTVGSSKIEYFAFFYNSSANKWHLMSKLSGF